MLAPKAKYDSRFLCIYTSRCRFMVLHNREEAFCRNTSCRRISLLEKFLILVEQNNFGNRTLTPRFAAEPFMAPVVLINQPITFTTMKKKSLLFLAICCLMLSCTKDKVNATTSSGSSSSSELIGSWKMIEVLADPGDGSGTFVAVESNKLLTFEANGVVSSNGRICDMSTHTDSPSSGTYSASQLSFNSADCTNADYDYSFELNGNTLIVTYPCIEACKAKFQKQQ